MKKQLTKDEIATLLDLAQEEILSLHEHGKQGDEDMENASKNYAKLLKQAKKGDLIHFPNGFASWMETHHEVVSWIAHVLSHDKTHVRERSPQKIVREYSDGGRGRMYEIAEELTDKFEEKYRGKEWDGEFFDAMDEFMEAYNNEVD